MSHSRNSRRGSKLGHLGKEMWSKRPTHYKMAFAGDRDAKRDTHRCERREAKREIVEELTTADLCEPVNYEEMARFFLKLRRVESYDEYV